VKVLSRTAGGVALVAGIVMGVWLLGDIGAMAGVVLAMLGFQALTRKVEGQHYVSAALITTAGLIVIGWKHGVTLTELGLGRSTWLTGLIWSVESSWRSGS